MVSIFLAQTKGDAFDSLKEQILLTSLSKKCPVFPKTQKVGGFSDLPGSSREFTFCKTWPIPNIQKRITDLPYGYLPPLIRATLM